MPNGSTAAASCALALLLLATAFVAPVSASAAVGADAGSAAAQAQYEKALEAGSRGDLREARRLVLEARAADPLHIPSRRVQDLLADHRVGYVGQEAAVQVFLGMIEQERGFWRSAAARYEAALALEPRYYLTIHGLGVVAHSTGNLDAAVARYREALELNPDYPYTHNNLGLAYAARGEHEKACEHLRKALDLAPDYFKAYNNLAVSLIALGRNDEADRLLARALDLRPGYGLAEANLRPRSRDDDSYERLPTGTLVELVERGAWDERARARDVLVDRADPAAAERMLKLLGSDSAQVRAAAAEILGPTRDPRALPVLAGLLAADPEWTVRFEAAWAVAHFPADAAVGPLAAALLSDPDFHVRVNAARMLSHLPGCPAYRALERGLSDAQPGVRATAKASLQQLRRLPAPGDPKTTLEAACGSRAAK